MNTDSSANARLHASVEGRVQGVSFRSFVSEQAQRLELSGWVRNRYTGEVEVLAEGNRHDLERLLSALHQGPPLALVSNVTTEWLPANGEFSSFWVRSTG